MDESEGHHRFKITELTQETHKKEPVPFFQLCPPSACLRKAANREPPRARCLKRLLGKSGPLFKWPWFNLSLNNLSLEIIYHYKLSVLFYFVIKWRQNWFHCMPFLWAQNLFAQLSLKKVIVVCTSTTWFLFIKYISYHLLNSPSPFLVL